MATDTRIWYLAGPMTGLPDYNYPRFHEVTAALRARGVTVLNPAEANVLNGVAPGTHDWRWYMRRALEMLAQADGIILLEDWEDSKGVSLEYRIAVDLDMLITGVEDWGL